MEVIAGGGRLVEVQDVRGGDGIWDGFSDVHELCLVSRLLYKGDGWWGCLRWPRWSSH